MTSLPGAGPAAQPSDVRCPACAARVVAGAPWCTQCFHAFGPPRVAVPAQPTAPPPVTPTVTPPVTPAPAREPGAVEGAVTGEVEPTWPCTSCGEPNAMSLAACTVCGAGFLAAARAQEPPLLDLPGVGDLTRLSRAQRLGLAALVVAAAGTLTGLLGLLFS